MAKDWIQISPRDNVLVALKTLAAGTDIGGATLPRQIAPGHKIAVQSIPAGQSIIKYGHPIGTATTDIAPGDHVHTHNIRTGLTESADYQYTPAPVADLAAGLENATFSGYQRADGAVGTRNEIWIINTVGCVNHTAERLAADARRRFAGRTDGVFTFVHPHGCSQLGEDHETTRRILLNLVKHPNAGGVLVLGLGCENNAVSDFKQALGEFDPHRVKFLVTQDVDDEIEAGMAILEEIVTVVENDSRVPCPVSDLVVGLKCGGSDGLSGITANPLAGRFSDLLTAAGGTTILTEVPEMFGAETILMNRCRDETVYKKTVALINDFKDYFIRHGQVVYENPSPGNKDGGITTLEEKSLGCVQKGGQAVVEDVIPYGGTVQVKGLNLLNGPGNDIVSTTALTAAGATIIVFTTGRGTPLGAPVPTVKVATNTDLATRKKHWIDFNAGVLVEDGTMTEVCEAFTDKILAVASGTPTQNERNNYREIAIFKDGVTL
ncbi:MAG: altronate dehydratase family protein [Lentisphaeria bacterium]|nr:altronate dehydratase family protein [Lentisphaeria bacterium]